MVPQHSCRRQPLPSAGRQAPSYSAVFFRELRCVPMSEMLTVREAAELLHLHVKRVQALARMGKLPAVRHGRKWLFPRQRLMQSLHGENATRGTTTGMDISARNQLRGRITALSRDGVMAEVRIQIGEQELVSVITRASADRLGLAVGDEVLAVIKSTEVMIAKPAAGE